MSGGDGVASTSGTVGRDELVAYAAQMGVNPRVVNRAAAASFDRRPLTAAETQELNVTFDGGQFLPWQNERDAGKVIARSTRRDGKWRAEVACDEGSRQPTFTYVVKEEGKWTYMSYAETIDRFYFAGLVVRRDKVGIASDGKHYRFSLPLPKGYAKRARDPKLDLKLQVYNNEGSPNAMRAYYIETTTQGYRQALTTVLKDCPLKP